MVLTSWNRRQVVHFQNGSLARSICSQTTVFDCEKYLQFRRLFVLRLLPLSLVVPGVVFSKLVCLYSVFSQETNPEANRKSSC